MVGPALRVNEFGLFAKVSAQVVKTRVSDSKFCARASKVKFRLSARPIIGASDYRRVRLSASIFYRPYPADNRNSPVVTLVNALLQSLNTAEVEILLINSY